MSHILAKLNGARLADVESRLRKDFLQHAEHGMFLEHLWQNKENSNEVFFLFRTLDLERARRFIRSTQGQADKENSGSATPEMTFLEGG
jgi:hypothetical protein